MMGMAIAEEDGMTAYIDRFWDDEEESQDSQQPQVDELEATDDEQELGDAIHV